MGDWGFPEGVYGQHESPRSCANIECIPCSWYAHLPLAFFFPELARSALRGFARFMREDGALTFTLGLAQEFIPRFDLYEYQAPLNGVCFVDLVGRLWQCTGDDTVLREFYPAVKKCTTWTMTQVPGAEEIISVSYDEEGGARSNRKKHWFENIPWYGMATHVAGMRLSNLAIVERMANATQDADYAMQCRDWYGQGQGALEEHLWNEEAGSYLTYWDREHDLKCDYIMASQFDGEWSNRIHGLPGVFDEKRKQTALETIKQSCLVEVGGAMAFAEADGNPLLTSYGIFTPETYLIGMTFMYEGDVETGLEMVRKCLANNAIRHLHPFDGPNMIHCDTGASNFGTDYNQNMMLWGMPSALFDQDLATLCGPGGFADAVRRAGNPEPEGVDMAIDSEDAYETARGTIGF